MPSIAMEIVIHSRATGGVQCISFLYSLLTGFHRRAPQQKCTLRENQVGITEFTNAEIAGFTGILKSRFSDFHVNEIDTEGHVLQMNDLKVPKIEIER